MKKFPCWVCKGAGGERDVVIPETGQGPYYECQYCEGEGMIEVGGEIHRKRKAEALGMEIVSFAGEKEREYTWDELREIGTKALALAT